MVEAPADRITELFEKGWALQTRMHEDLAYLDQAIALHEEALALAPANEEANWRLAEVLFKKSEEVDGKAERKAVLERTVTLSEQALALNPESVGGLYWAGTALARLADISGVLSSLKQVRQARTYLHQAVRIAPDHRFSVLARVVLTMIYYESPWPLKDMNQALELVRSAVEMDPNLTLASLWLGKVHLAQGKTEAARSELKRCLATEQPTYIWDAVLYDWPEARTILAGMKP